MSESTDIVPYRDVTTTPHRSPERVVLFLSDLNDSHLFCHSVGTSNAFERNEQFSVDNNCFNLTHYPQEDQSVPLSPTSKLLKRFKQTENRSTIFDSLFVAECGRYEATSYLPNA